MLITEDVTSRSPNPMSITVTCCSRCLAPNQFTILMWKANRWLRYCQSCGNTQDA
jgi:hypothetical protein